MQAEADRATVRFEVRGTPLRRPLLVLRGYGAQGAPARVTLDGALLQADADYYASVDAGGRALWLTLARDLQGSATLAID